ncbi:MAG TPA: zinc ribbon domain-containing protein, partial [Phaeodactylibacter sp.]|nr:zinc ribbon domain-containing protein [Phaeodactylibacter sp.]
MKKCNTCNTRLLENARFCHHCGAKVVAAFTASSAPKYHLYFQNIAKLPHLIEKYFLEAFKERITEQHQEKMYDKYFERLQQSEFKKRLELRWKQLAEEAYIIHAKQNNVAENIDILLSKNFNNLLDHFIILECKDLNEFYLPEKILTYQELRQGDFDIQKMILDFLDLENEKETYYTDFIIMPTKKLKNASQAFLFPHKDEKIIVIADQTIFGSCKEGFAMTEKGIYWKAHFEDA